MGYTAYREMQEYKKSVLSLVRDNEVLLREKYSKALLILLNYLYEKGIIYNYHKFLQSQSDVIKDPIAPNGVYYENNDILALKSKGITDRDKQIKQLILMPKYSDKLSWDEWEPNMVIMDGSSSMTDEFSGETYMFVLEELKEKIKRINSKLYDRVIYTIYKFNEDIDDYDKVGIGSYFYRSGSMYKYRYMNLYDELGVLLPDLDHSMEYSADNSAKNR